MHRTNGAGHVGNLFVNEDPATNRPPTEVPADWLNAVQEEIANVATMNGEVLETPGADGFTQMRDAILARIAAMSTVVSTAPQFDNDLSLATTEFVQRALGNFRGFVGLEANTVLTAADVGNSYEVAHSSTPFAVTLPLSDAAINGGGTMYFRNDNISAVTIQRQGADVIQMGNSGGVTSMVLQRGDDVWLMKGSDGNWYGIGGSARLRYSDGDFGKSLAVNGYQKLPSGLIIQWGQVHLGTGSSAYAADITFPIAFPTACINFIASIGVNAPDLDINSYRTARQAVAAGAPTSAGCEIQAFIDNLTGSARDIYWVARGY